MMKSCQPPGYSSTSRLTAFLAETAGQVAADGMTVSGHYLQLDAVYAKHVKRPGSTSCVELTTGRSTGTTLRARRAASSRTVASPSRGRPRCPGRHDHGVRAGRRSCAHASRDQDRDYPAGCPM
jgi:hypothetical protein